MLYKSIRVLTKRGERPPALAFARITLALALVALFAVQPDAGKPAHAQGTSDIKLYIADRDDDNIRRSNLDGTSVETLITGLGNPIKVDVDISNGKVYWLEETAGDIKRANLDGTSVETVTTDAPASSTFGGYGGFALDLTNDKIYWVGFGSNFIKRSNLDGSSVETLISSGLNGTTDIALDVANGKMYWTETNSLDIRRANLDGTSIETLVDNGGSGLTHLALDLHNSKMYWSAGANRNLRRANLNGSSPEVIVPASNAPSISTAGIAVDGPNNKLYWVERGSSSGRIKRANLDGSSVETVIGSGLDDPRDIVIPSKSNIPSVSVTGKTETTVILDWDDIEDATDYQYRYKTSEETNWGDPVTVTASTALVSGLISGTAYNFQARSRENGEESNWSAIVTATPSPRELSISRWPARVGGLTVVSEGTDAVQLLWQHQVNAAEYEIGLWEAGQILSLSLIQDATSTITTPDVWTQIIESVGVSGGATYGKFDEERSYVGIYADDPAKLLMLQHRRYSGDILYYWNTGLGRWRVLRCKTPTNADEGCDYGTPASNDVEALLTISSSVFSWHTMEDGPPDWAGLYRTEADALESVESAGDTVIFLDALGFTRYSRLNPTTPSAIVTGIPEGRQYLSVRGKNATGQNGDWAYLVTVGAPGTTPAPGAGQPVAISGIIYTDQVPNIEHYLIDDTTLNLTWQALPGARHYDVRWNAGTFRITALSGSAQQVALSLAKLQGKNVGYQVRAVISTGSLDVRVKDAEGTVIYVVPPNSTVFSRWSADRTVNVERVETKEDSGRIKGPGTDELISDPEGPDDLVTDIIRAFLQLSSLVDEDDDFNVQVWTVPIGLLGSIFLGGLTGYGASRGGMDKAAIIAGGLVFFVCWAYLCPVYLKVSWQIVFSVIALIIGAGIVVALNEYLK